MDFVRGLPLTQKGNESIWVIVDRLTKSADFLPVKATWSLEKLAEVYIAEIVRLHGVPISIIYDRDPRFTSRFWQSAMGNRLNFSITYHPETDGQFARTIKILEHMLRACVLDFGGILESWLPLVKFTYNNRYQSIIGIAPYEALYRRKCGSPLHPDLVQ